MKRILLIVFLIFLAVANANANIFVLSGGADVTPPTLQSATIDGSSVTLNFSEAVSQGTGWANSEIDFDMSVTGNNIAFTYVGGSGTATWTGTTASPAVAGETVDIDFNGDSTADVIEDAAGNDLAAITSGTVTNDTDSYADIVFWLNFEENDTTGDYDMGTSECSDGDTSGEYHGDMSINSTSPLVGSYDVLFDDAAASNGVDYMEFAVTNNDIAPTEGAYGLMVNVGTFGSDYQYIGHYVDSNNSWVARMDGITGDVEVYYKQGGTGTYCTWTDVDLSTSTTYYVEIRLDPDNDQILLEVDGGTTYSETARTVTGMTTVGANGFLRIGCSSSSDDGVYNGDQYIISNDITRDLNALKNTTSCPAN